MHYRVNEALQKKLGKCVDLIFVRLRLRMKGSVLSKHFEDCIKFECLPHTDLDLLNRQPSEPLIPINRSYTPI